ncbi:MAG TPA: nucleotidyltransferase domain-containing protein [Amaricoccus sp.]|jgi:predicted nucleotidyltransferase|nr:nucleotidyltransferase domain-containing protein [Amaricoccus sp.]
MNRDEVMADVRQHRAALEAEGVTHVYLFGSVLHGDARADSDVDLLFDHSIPRFSLLDYAHLKSVAADLLGREVDFIARASLHPRLKARVEAEALRIF